MKLKTNFNFQTTHFIRLNVVCLFLFVCIENTFAQQGQFSFHIGPALPTSDYGDDSATDSDAGRAGIGLNAGLQYLHPITDSGLSLFLGLDANYNGLKKDFRDDIDDANPAADVKFYNYLNFPVTGGLSYNVNVNDQFELFLEGGAAFNFLQLTDYVFEFDQGETEYSFEMATRLGVKFGGGVKLNETTSIAIHYYGLGEHDIDFEQDNGAGTSRGDVERTVTFVTITLGFLLN